MISPRGGDSSALRSQNDRVKGIFANYGTGCPVKRKPALRFSLRKKGWTENGNVKMVLFFHIQVSKCQKGPLFLIRSIDLLSKFPSVHPRSQSIDNSLKSTRIPHDLPTSSSHIIPVTVSISGFESFGAVRYANIGSKAPESGETHGVP